MCGEVAVKLWSFVSLENREEELYTSASEKKLFGLAKRGDIEKADPLSETSEGAPSTDSALDPSETAGEGRGPSGPCRQGKPEGVRSSGRPRGLANDSGWAHSSKVVVGCVDVLRRRTRRRRRFMLPFHQFLTALSLRPWSLRAISAHRFPISPTMRSI
jgi:hypothetical protein